VNLETYQRSLHRLVIYGEPGVDDPPYVQALAGSSSLAVVRETVCFWRAHSLERTCILTATWLKGLGRFETEIERFVATEIFSPYADEAKLQFLRFLVTDNDPLVSALAKFEIALEEIRSDSCETMILEWPCDPKPILSAILHDSDIPEPVTSRRYRVTISNAIPDGFVCEPME
jgi:hypothetical protein